MLDNAKLRERLSAITRARRFARDESAIDREGAPRFPPAVPCEADGHDPGAAPLWSWQSTARTGVESFLAGGEWCDELGAVYVHERLRSEIEKPKPHWGRLGEPPETEPDLLALAAAGISRAIFLDLETGGLASSPVFLAGTMRWNGETFVLRQYFARHYGEEGALLRALAEEARGYEFLVTFNGKSYDAPFLKGRAVTHGVRLDLPPFHVDLLHIARRRWRADLPDCRLQTLERHVCRRWRSGDVPSDEVPGLYHDFVRDGDPWRLIPVFHHNLLDVIAMGEILQALCTPPRVPRRAPGVPLRIE